MIVNEGTVSEYKKKTNNKVKKYKKQQKKVKIIMKIVTKTSNICSLKYPLYSHSHSIVAVSLNWINL